MKRGASLKILVVEDELDLNSIMCKYLKKEGYSIDSAFDGSEAIDFLKVGEYDLILSDIMMPEIDGYQLLKWCRENRISSPILMLTAKDNLDDKVKGLDMGADDYLVKPFEFEELLARIRVLLRRKFGRIDNKISVDDLTINLSNKTVERAGKNINLTAKEYELLEFLMLNKDKIVSREQLQEHVWDFDYEGYSNVIDVLIKNIRKKIDLGDSKQVIFTKRGLGYVVKEDK